MDRVTEIGATGSPQLDSELEALATLARTIAHQYQGKSLELLGVLRVLECLHQEIRDSLFQQSLPDTRQALYTLLRDIEMSGGWPYIHRMKLQSFLANLPREDATRETDD
ncbi:MAG: hypothetical protein MUF72_20750 [Elainella sp. Prado103]|jgi:hypothetical protein|nr:hypothetical protein [Elainella sp. Prado103]